MIGQIAYFNRITTRKYLLAFNINAAIISMRSHCIICIVNFDVQRIAGTTRKPPEDASPLTTTTHAHQSRKDYA